MFRTPNPQCASKWKSKIFHIEDVSLCHHTVCDVRIIFSQTFFSPFWLHAYRQVKSRLSLEWGGETGEKASGHIQVWDKSKECSQNCCGQLSPFYCPHTGGTFLLINRFENCFREGERERGEGVGTGTKYLPMMSVLGWPGGGKNCPNFHFGK